MECIKKHITGESLGKWIGIYIILQPIIDFLTSFMVRFSSSSVTIGIVFRFLFLLLLGCIVIFYVPWKQKKLSLIFVFLSILYGIGYLFVNFDTFGVLFVEIKGFMKTFFLPYTVVFLYDLCRYYKVKIKLNYLVICGLIYIGVIFVAAITNSSFFSYQYDKVGHVGWFYAANEIGAIIGLLSFLVFYSLGYLKNKIISYILLIAYGFISLLIGTKVPFFGVCIAFVVLIIYYMIIKERKKTILFVCAFVTVLAFAPFSNLAKNLGIHINILQTKEEISNEQISNSDKLTSLVLSDRNIFFEQNMNLFSNQDIVTKAFGIGYYYDGEEYKLIEMDFADILVSQGIIGFILIFALALYFIINILRNIIAKKFAFDEISFLCFISLGVAIAISFIAGHVLVAPAVSIYVVLFIVQCKWMRIEDKSI
ncbi:MAG: O-antigen ligase family protein [Erysipelotrichaceae bacterium]|nr:O-antigen ligase family protein [Erysipelotrichaceae bacterium]